MNSLDTFAFTNKNLTIEGNNNKLITTSFVAPYRRGFFVGGSGTSSLATNKVTIQNLTIEGAQAQGGDSEFGGAGAGLGGALFVGKQWNLKAVV